MAHEPAAKPKPEKKLVLPKLAVSEADVKRLLRELEALVEFLDQNKIRSPGSSVKLPKTSRLLDELAADNGLNLLQPDDLAQLKTFLKHVKDKSPQIHISFSSDPSAVFTNKIVTWFRREIDPTILLQIGLQPNLAVGCIVRTTNKQFDLSMRKAFNEQRNVLLEKLGAIKKDDASPEPKVEAAAKDSPATDVEAPAPAVPAATAAAAPATPVQTPTVTTANTPEHSSTQDNAADASPNTDENKADDSATAVEVKVH